MSGDREQQEKLMDDVIENVACLGDDELKEEFLKIKHTIPFKNKEKVCWEIASAYIEEMANMMKKNGSTEGVNYLLNAINQFEKRENMAPDASYRMRLTLTNIFADRGVDTTDLLKKHEG